MKNIYIYYQHTQGDHPLKEQLHKIWHFDELFFFKFLWEWQVLYDTVSLTYSIHHHCFPSLMYLSLCISIHWFGIFIGNWIFFSEYTYVKYIILNHHHFWWKLIELFAAKFYIHTKRSIFWYIKNQKVAQEGKKVVFKKTFAGFFWGGGKKG